MAGSMTARGFGNGQDSNLKDDEAERCCGCSIRTKFYFSFACNVVCVVLIIVVFFMLGNLKIQLDSHEALFHKSNNVGHYDDDDDGSNLITASDGRLSLQRSTKNTLPFENGKFAAKGDTGTVDTGIEQENETATVESLTPVSTVAVGSPALGSTDAVKTTGQIYKRSTHRTSSSVVLPTRTQRQAVLMRNGSTCACVGLPGASGRQGAAGEKGRKGKRGSKGDTGDIGLPGANGSPGMIGPKGVPGWPGKIGPMGNTGSPGIAGPSGPPGPKGDSGHTVRIRPSAHITGRVASPVIAPQGILKNWQDRYGLAHSYGGMKYNDGKLTIPRTGFYHIYSQVYFQADEPKDHLMVSFIYRISASTRGILIRSVATKCQAPNVKQAFYTAYNAGVFRLYQGDTIMVGVSPEHQSLVSFAESATFFGAYEV